jgi:hypothetical protein
LDISEPPLNVLELSNMARKMKKFTAQLDAPSASGNRVIYLGGEAQLEGLAQISQTHSIEHSFGVNEVVEVTREYIHRLAPGGPYRAIEKVSGTLGCTRERKGFIIANTGLAAALFVTALCGRFYGAGPQPAEDLVSPPHRLVRMVTELGSKVGRFDMPDEEAAALVDGVARRLWGRTAFEEIAGDIDAMEAKADSLSVQGVDSEGLYDAFKDFVALRRRLLIAAREAGPSSVLPRAFPVVWRDRLLPWQVVATPGGSWNDGDAPVVFGTNLNVPPELETVLPSLVVWGRLHSAPSAVAREGFAPSARAAWLRMLEFHGPIAHLMLNGRRHRRMLPPELERPLDEINELGIPVRFHPRFEWPEQRDQKTRVSEAIALADFSGRGSFVCDITGDELKPADAAVLTPWEFRKSPLLPKFREGNPLADAKLLMDWSDWVVRRDLLDKGVA